MNHNAKDFLDLTDERLRLFAQSIAKENPKGRPVKTERNVKKVRKALADIGRTYKKTIAYIEKETLIPQEMEWITDNYYIAQNNGDEAAQAIRSFRKLPSLCMEPRKVYAAFLAEDFLQATGYFVNEEKAASFLRGVSEEAELTEEELAAFLSFVRAETVCIIAEVCVEIDLILRGYEGRDSDSCFCGEIKLWRERDSMGSPTGHQQDQKKKAVETHEMLSDLLRRAFGTLRFLSEHDFNTLLKEQNPVEKILQSDPSGDYGKMSEKSRAYYRYRLSSIAKKEGLSGVESARRVVRLAEASKSARQRHVGFYILEKPLGREKEKLRGRVYLASILALTLSVAALFSYFAENLPALFLFLVPAFEIAKRIVDFFVIRVVPPAHLPRLEFLDGIPEAGKTLCVITALCTSASDVKKLSSLLHEYLVSNRDAGEHVGYGLLLDLRDSKTMREEKDEEIIRAAKDAVAEVTKETGGRLFVFLRERTLNELDGVYMGYERKRGALFELIAKIRGKNSGVRVLCGDEKDLGTYRLLITLDSDTRPEPESIRALAGTALHPLNRPEVDGKTKTVTRGHGILQPGILTSLDAANRSFFSSVYAGVGGIDPYTSAISDVYQDLFSEGIYTGKGLIDIDAFYEVMDGRFPENRILSHDLLEGIYLRAGFVSDVQFIDGFPFKVSSYFTRLHRWIRGDFQVSPWLLRNVPAPDGEKTVNPINIQGKWKIFDNLRRSLTPFFLFALLMLGALLSNRFFIPCLILSLLSVMMPLLTDLAVVLFRGDGMRKYHSNILTGVPANALHALIDLSFLPHQAIIGLGACLTALYRMNVSGRNLLQWVTADQADRKEFTPARYHRLMLPSLLSGAFLILFGNSILSLLLGALWAASPQMGYLISREKKKKDGTDDIDRTFLKREAAFIWSYFEAFLRPEDHYLPPDNYQEQPPVGLARRTSPTNIGLSLLCVFSAKDLGLIDETRALFLIDKIVATVERMEKWNGHLYNWYETRRARPLHPKCVSSVDSGNFLACLIVVIQALAEFSSEEAKALSERVLKLEEAIDLRPLYDEKRRLFFISRDVETGRTSGGVYDLMASEARILSFVAVALGQAPKKHWERLGRGLTELNGYRGMLSWTGTMFEYLMPNLLMPAYPNSMLYESMQFAVYAQKANGRKRNTPFGISESAFYAFDNAMNYQYKAHGVQRLGLKRGLDREQVVSPYSSFLALSVDPKGAIRNLRRLRDLGMEGRYGFFEACDFTASRLPGQKEYALVRCYMAHHIGMSLISISNLLSEKTMPDRFMRDTRMRAYRVLLCEKIPVGAPVLRVMAKDVPEKPKPASIGLLREFSFSERKTPMIHLLTNGSYRLMLTEDGRSRAESGRMQLLSFSPSDPSVFSGMGFFLKTEMGLLPLLKMPFYDETAQYSGRFEAARAIHVCKTGSVLSQIRTSVLDSMDGEIRQVELKNTAGKPFSCELLVYFEPQVENSGDFYSHPAFSKLFLKTEIIGNAVVIRRRPRNAGEEERGIVFCCDTDTRFDTSKEKCLGRGGVRRIEDASGREAMSTDGAVLDPCVLARVKLKLSAGETKMVSFGLASGRDLPEILLHLERELLKKSPDFASRQESCARMLGLSKKDVADAMELYSQMIFSKTPFDREAVLKSRFGQRDLWRFGISGELPIAAVFVGGEEEAKKCAAWIKKHIFCFLNGAPFDLVLFTSDGGDYRCPSRTALLDALKTWGGESLAGFRGGVHFIDEKKVSDAERDFLVSCAAVLLEPGRGLLKKAFPPPGLFRMEPRRIGEGTTEASFDENGAYRIECKKSLPGLVQSHILANDAFGYIATDCGAGHMWFQNSRENKLNAWINDPLALSGPEQVKFHIGDKTASVFASPDDECTVTYAPGYARYEKEVCGVKLKTTVFIAGRLPCRIILAEASGGETEDLFLSSGTTLLLGSSMPSSNHIVSGYSDSSGAVYVQNRYNTEFSPYYFAAMGSGRTTFTCSLPSYLSSSFDGSSGAGLDPCLAVKTSFEKQEDGRIIAVLLHFACGKLDAAEHIKKLLCVKEAEKELEAVNNRWKAISGSLQIETGDTALDRYMNVWALYQTLCCRVLARTSFYQNGGAYGFRDQLQDVAALLYACPDVSRTHILRASAHQFLEGDVQHWWHYTKTAAGDGHRGIRTKCSDDLLWLPYVLCEYIDKTDDLGILEFEVPYIESPPLDETTHERYETPRVSKTKESVFLHACRACDLSLKRGAGEHGLALFGTCDWNDGMNLVGAGGRGESVWLSWFLAVVLRKMARLCERLGEKDRASRYLKKAEEYESSAENAWDDDRFLRGYYDDGEPLGAKSGDECRIDSVAQSFAALVPCDEKKRETAIRTAKELLFDRENRIVALLTPPFENGKKNPGYIKGYLPGVRENGGQYTHAAVWLSMGCFQQNMAEDGYEILKALLPENHPEKVYKAEPFVLAADVYTNPQHVGRGGWSHYTGASGWFYRVVAEWMLGFKAEGNSLVIKPALPDCVGGYRAVLRKGDAEYNITVRRKKDTDKGSVLPGVIPLEEGGAHTIDLEL